MISQSTTSFNASSGLFSPEEIRRLMRIEYERSKRYQYPTACMLIGVDRLGALQDIYGMQAKAEIVQSVVELLEQSTRASDFLGCLVDDRVLAVFPHTSKNGAQFLAKRLLKGARGLTFEADGRTMRISLSIGIAHNEDHSAVSFDTLLSVAEDGLRVAESSGGDRFTETELYQLYESRKEREDKQRGTPAYSPFDDEKKLLEAKMQALEERQSLVETDLVDRRELDEAIALRAQAEQEAEQAQEARLEAERRGAELERERDGLLTGKGVEIDQLQRRLDKLVAQLGLTEKELSRVLQMKSVDEGIASTYDEVQGLDHDDGNYAAKKDLMSAIFEANIALKQALAERRRAAGEDPE